jgi:ABC-type branched-subunit amino acid transport system ATPase component
MSAGIMRSWQTSKLIKSKTPVEYFFAIQEYMLYEYSVAKFNTMEKFKEFLDKCG